MEITLEAIIFALLGCAIIVTLITSEIKKCKVIEAWQSEKKQRKEYEVELYTRFLRVQDENWELQCENRRLREENVMLQKSCDNLTMECARMAEYIDQEQVEVTANED